MPNSLLIPLKIIDTRLDQVDEILWDNETRKGNEKLEIKYITPKVSTLIHTHRDKR